MRQGGRDGGRKGRNRKKETNKQRNILVSFNKYITSSFMLCTPHQLPLG
jgi:hypothetical protein